MESKSYTIPQPNICKLEVKILRFNKSAEKLRLPQISMVETGKRVLKVLVYDEYGNHVDDRPMMHVDVVITGATPVISGWKFAGKVEHVDGRNIVKDYGRLPARLYKSESKCEHCGKKRHRKNTYFLVNEDGEYKQVGRTCLRDFTGANDPHMAADIAEFFAILMGGEGEEWDEWMETRSAQSEHFETAVYLAWVVRAYQHQGQYISRNDSMRGLPTCDAAMDLWNEHGRRGEHPLTEVEKDEAARILKWIQDSFGAPDANPSSYEFNLLQLATPNVDGDCYFHRKHIGYVASMLPTYRRGQARQQEAELGSQSQFVGKVGKARNWELELVDRVGLGWQSYGRVSTKRMLYKFVDGDGNVVVWFTEDHGFRKGQKFAGRAKVKSHQRYNNSINQTVINYARLKRAVTPLPDGEDAELRTLWVTIFGEGEVTPEEYAEAVFGDFTQIEQDVRMGLQETHSDFPENEISAVAGKLQNLLESIPV